MPAIVYLIPSELYEGVIKCLPSYILEAIKECQQFYVENERTTRRFFKRLDKQIQIEQYEWFVADRESINAKQSFRQGLEAEKVMGIVSEAGCPGIADPGQELVFLAHQANAIVKPLVGPSSITLALMASGLNGQNFRFNGYLPIDSGKRIESIKQLESHSRKTGCTEIFIETPYRNNQMLKLLTQVCAPESRLCLAVDLTSPGEWIKTQTIAKWKMQLPEVHKRVAIFLLQSGN